MGVQSAREFTLLALRRWRTSNILADAILGRALDSSGLVGSERAFATELFYGILRNLTLLDFWIAAVRPRHLDHDARDLLRLGLYQLFILEVSEHAAVYETVELAGRSVRSLVNAVLRKAVREKEQLLAGISALPLSVRTSHPQFLIARWTRSFGLNESEALCEWNNLPAPIYVRINQLKISVDQFLEKYSDAEKVPHHKNFVRVGKVPHEALALGHCYVQDPSTATACRLLDPRPGENVLDACAAPGGKSGYISEIMTNRGTLTVCDRDEKRLEMLTQNLENLGITIARCQPIDWTGSETRTSPHEMASFDRILIDAPCSNTGVMRRRVDLRWRLVPEEFRRMNRKQLKILRAAMPLLKPGGVVVYSTCSIEPEENQEVVDTIMNEFPALAVKEQVSLVPFRDGFDGCFAAKMQWMP